MSSVLPKPATLYDFRVRRCPPDKTDNTSLRLSGKKPPLFRGTLIFALLRQILTVAGTALVAKGFVQASDVEPVIGALLTIGSVIWSVADKRQS